MPATNSSTSYQETIYYKLDGGSKERKPSFIQKASKEEGYKELEHFDTIDGVFIYDVSLKENEHNVIKYVNVQLCFENSLQQREIIEGNINSGVMRSLLNTLCNADYHKPIKMKLYVNKAGYNAIYITQAETPVRWAYSIDEQPKPIKYKTPSGEEKYDDKNVVDWYKNLVTNELKNKLLLIGKGDRTGLPDVPTKQEMPLNNQSYYPDQNKYEESDGLPF